MYFFSSLGSRRTEYTYCTFSLQVLQNKKILKPRTKTNMRLNQIFFFFLNGYKIMYACYTATARSHFKIISTVGLHCEFGNYYFFECLQNLNVFLNGFYKINFEVHDWSIFKTTLSKTSPLEIFTCRITSVKPNVVILTGKRTTQLCVCVCVCVCFLAFLDAAECQVEKQWGSLL